MNKKDLIRHLSNLKDNYSDDCVHERFDRVVIDEAIAYIEKDGGAEVPCSGVLSRFIFDGYHPFGNRKMAEGANVLAANEKDALTEARKMFGQEWVFKLRKKET